MTDESRSPITAAEVLSLSIAYLLILVVSVKLGYLFGLALLGVALVLFGKILARLLKRYLWDQWAIINAEELDPSFFTPGVDNKSGGSAFSVFRKKKSGARRSKGVKGVKGDKGGKGVKGDKGDKSGKGDKGGKDKSGGTADKSEKGGGGGKGEKAGKDAARESRADQAGGSKAATWRLDWRPLVILAFTAVVLTLLEYWGSRKIYNELMPKYFPYAPGYPYRELGVSAFGTHYQRLGEYVYWVGFRVMFFFVIPAGLILALPGERLRDYGLSVRDFFKHLPIYGILFAIVLPAVIAVSFTKAFANHYPFYKPWMSATAPRGLYLHDFFAWELMYAAQFFSLEFFFRGFLLHALKRSMGAYAIFVMAVPYCMIHFGKPMPETLGAIVAGIVLGTLALRTRSIWAGVLIHVSVAWSMDWLALLQTGRFPSHW